MTANSAVWLLVSLMYWRCQVIEIIFFLFGKTIIFNCLDNKEKLYAWGKTKFFNFKENFETEFMLTPHKIKLVSKNSVKGKFENPTPRTDILNNLEEMFAFIYLFNKKKNYLEKSLDLRIFALKTRYLLSYYKL